MLVAGIVLRHEASDVATGAVGARAIIVHTRKEVGPGHPIRVEFELVPVRHCVRVHVLR